MATSVGPTTSTDVFEHLKNHVITSQSTPIYNCIAWAAGRNDRWWWPQGPRGYWPQEKGDEANLKTFENAFQTLGYEVCTNGQLEAGLEKVAIYAKGNEVTHMARQMANGWWASKLGRAQDIEHQTAQELQGSQYGMIVRFMARVRS